MTINDGPTLLVIERETTKFVGVPVVDENGALITSGVKYLVTPESVVRPLTGFATGVTKAGELGVIVGPFAVGNYIVWAQVTDSTDSDVIPCGLVIVI